MDFYNCSCSLFISISVQYGIKFLSSTTNCSIQYWLVYMKHVKIEEVIIGTIPLCGIFSPNSWVNNYNPSFISWVRRLIPQLPFPFYLNVEDKRLLYLDIKSIILPSIYLFNNFGYSISLKKSPFMESRIEKWGKMS